MPKFCQNIWKILIITSSCFWVQNSCYKYFINFQWNIIGEVLKLHFRCRNLRRKKFATGVFLVVLWPESLLSRLFSVINFWLILCNFLVIFPIKSLSEHDLGTTSWTIKNIFSQTVIPDTVKKAIKNEIFKLCKLDFHHCTLHAFFYKSPYFSTQLQCCLTFS